MTRRILFADSSSYSHLLGSRLATEATRNYESDCDRNWTEGIPLTRPAKGLDIPPTLLSTGAIGFWLAVVLTGVGAGVGAVALTRLLQLVQHLLWPGPHADRRGQHMLMHSGIFGCCSVRAL
jgi:hypothetical protein